MRLWRNGHRTTFIGLDAVRKIGYSTTRNEDTRCYFCKNNCLRTFIDVRTEPKNDMSFVPIQVKVPLHAGERRLIIATCEKGTVEDVNAMRGIKAGLDEIKKRIPNFVDIAAQRSLAPAQCEERCRSAARAAHSGSKAAKERIALMEKRKKLRIGMPRVLNMYTYAPLFSGYFESLGVQPENIVYSDFTSPEIYRAGASRGAIDPCFPSKIGIPHVYNLIREAPQEAARRHLLPHVSTCCIAAGETHAAQTPARP